MANLYFSPPETGSSFVPNSSLLKNFSIAAAFAAVKTSSFVESNFPYKIFSYTLLLN